VDGLPDAERQPLAILLRPKLWYLLNLRVEFEQCSIPLAENRAIGPGLDPCTVVRSRS
jgi:hypothetical protein